MTPEEQRGRVIAVSIGAALVVISVLSFFLVLLVRRHVGPFQLFQLGASVVLAWLMFKGYGWARAYVAFSLLLGGVFLLLLPILARRPLGLIIALPISAAYVAAGLVLWKSKSVEAFFDRQAEIRNAPPSIRGSGGV